DTERLEQKSRQGEKEEDAKEGPVTDHVQAPHVVAFSPGRAPVAQPKRPLNPALVGHDRQPCDEGGAKQVEKERVPPVKVVPEEVPVQDRLCYVVLEREDGCSDEEDDEAVEDQEVARARQRVAPLDPRMGEDDTRCAPQARERPIEVEGPA